MLTSSNRVQFNKTMRNDYPNLDFLRATAVLIVSSTHLIAGLNRFAWPIVEEIGYFGVLIFFVHTSLVLSMSLDRQNEHRPSSGLFLPFMLRRCFRIYPLSMFVVLAVFIFNLPLADMNAGGFYYSSRELFGLFSNLFLVQNIMGAGSTPFVLWSLPYEMQMYLALPALYLLTRKTVTLWPLLLISTLARMASHLKVTGYLAAVPDFLAYVPYFTAGVIAFKIMKMNVKPRLAWQLWPLLIGLALVPWLYLRHLAPVAACMTIGFTVSFFKQIPSGLLATWSHRIAKYSFGIYLTHAFCIWFAFYKLEHLAWWLKFPIFSLLFVLLPFCLYHCLEAPMIRVGARLAERVGNQRVTAEDKVQVASAI